MTDKDLEYAMRLQEEEMQALQHDKHHHHHNHHHNIEMDEIDDDVRKAAKKILQQEDTIIIDDTPDVHKPYVIYGLIMANVIFFIMEIGQNGWKFQPMSENMMLGPSLEVLLELGAKWTPSIVNNGEFWRLFIPMFLHGGVIHIVFNMAFALKIGRDHESQHGHWRTLVLWIICGFSGNLTSAIFLPEYIGVGASGAIFGLLGALFGEWFQNRGLIEDANKYILSLCLSTAFGLAFGLLPALDNFAHVGGFLGGILTGAFLLRLSDEKGRASIKGDICSIITSTTLLLLIVIGLIILYTSVDIYDWCPFCRYVSCVPIAWDCCNCLNNVTGEVFGCPC